MNIAMIPLSKLIPSAANVRKTGATAGIAELAASIKAHGLLQNLQVRAADGGKFEVVAGRRRLAALKRLARNKDIEKLDIELPVLAPRIYREYKNLEALNVDARQLSIKLVGNSMYGIAGAGGGEGGC